MTPTAPDFNSAKALTVEDLHGQIAFWNQVVWSVRNGVVYYRLVELPKPPGEWIKADKDLVKRLLEAGSEVMNRFVTTQTARFEQEIADATPAPQSGGTDPALGPATTSLDPDAAGISREVPLNPPADDRHEDLGERVRRFTPGFANDDQYVEEPV